MTTPQSASIPAMSDQGHSAESDRTPAQRRMIRVFVKRGGKGFRILRSAERPLRQYARVAPPEVDQP